MSGRRRENVWEYYTFAFIVSGVITFFVVRISGMSALVPLLALAAIEITFSFENAVLNSQVLAGMSKFWQMMFLTIGIAIAVFGVRLLLPLALVAATTDNTIKGALELAIHQPEVYEQELTTAYPVIAAFGGVFLLMIGLRFFGEKRQVKWLDTVEAPLGEFNQPWWVTVVGAVGAVSLVYGVLAPGDVRLAKSAALGALTYVVIKVLSYLLLRRQIKHTRASKNRHYVAAGWAGLAQFMYLELLDASFSFDGVIASFAITKDILLITAGLGIGAMFVRSITMHLLHHGTLQQYRYLIHGAHYAITALAVIMLFSIRVHLPELLSGVLGILIITASILSSVQANQREAKT